MVLNAACLQGYFDPTPEVNTDDTGLDLFLQVSTVLILARRTVVPIVPIAILIFKQILFMDCCYVLCCGTLLSLPTNQTWSLLGFDVLSLVFRNSISTDSSSCEAHYTYTAVIRDIIRNL